MCKTRAQYAKRNCAFELFTAHCSERRIIERRITERRITERRITERRKLPNVEYYRTSNITERVEYYRT